MRLLSYQWSKGYFVGQEGRQIMDERLRLSPSVKLIKHTFMMTQKR